MAAMEPNIHYGFALRLYRGEEKFFGPGVARLLSLVEQKGSLRKAALGMGMAYSKAWRMVRAAENILGFPLLLSCAGGKNGGGAVLTPDGRAFLAKYLAFEQALQKSADQLFASSFG